MDYGVSELGSMPMDIKMFDVDKPFLPQYDQNLQALLRCLSRLLGKEE